MENQEIKTITAEELKEKIEYSINLTVVNVLSKEEFDDCHIKGSISAPLEHLKTIAKDWDKRRKIVLYCATNISSTKAYKILNKIGFTDVLLYHGGMKEWKEKGFNYTGPGAADYLN